MAGAPGALGSAVIFSSSGVMGSQSSARAAGVARKAAARVKAAARAQMVRRGQRAMRVGTTDLHGDREFSLRKKCWVAHCGAEMRLAKKLPRVNRALGI